MIVLLSWQLRGKWAVYYQSYLDTGTKSMMADITDSDKNQAIFHMRKTDLFRDGYLPGT
jgi:hypothetical protein